MRLLSTVRLTDNQKRVIAKIASAATPAVAGEQISKDPNLIAARNILMKLGVITFVDGKAALTDRGQQLGKEENILDDSGGVTDTGNQLATTTATGQPEAGSQPQAATGGEMPPPDTGMGGGDMDMSMGGEDDWGGEPADQEVKQGGEESLMKRESFNLLKQLLS